MHREADPLKTVRTLAASLGALLAAAGLVAAQQAAPATPAEAPRIEGPELKRLVEKGEAVIVDVRGREAWDAAHAEGAIHIPLAELSARLKDVPKDKLIAAYCT